MLYFLFITYQAEHFPMTLPPSIKTIGDDVPFPDYKINQGWMYIL